MTSFNNSSTALESKMQLGNMSTSFSEPQLMFQVLFSVIAFLAIFQNSLLCIAIQRDRHLPKSSFSRVLFNLIVCDALLGVFIAATPGYIIGLDSFPVPRGVGGELFCRLISTQYLVFVVSKVSVLTIVALALERWYSVAKPIEYKTSFKRRRVYIYIPVIWLLSCVFNGSKSLEAKLDESPLRCSRTGMSYPKEIITPAYAMLTFFIPITIVWLTFCHAGKVLKQSPSRNNNVFRNTRRKLTRVSGMVALLLTVFWLPNQVFNTLSAFDITATGSTVHNLTIALAMSKSCVNPWLYCYNNRQYMRALKRLLPFVNSANEKTNQRTFPGVRSMNNHSVGQVIDLSTQTTKI